MTTSEINTTRLHLFHGEFATEVVMAMRERLQRPRIIAIGRSVAGQPFQVIAPPTDFAEAVVEVMSRPVLPAQEECEYPPLSDEPGYSEGLCPFQY